MPRYDYICDGCGKTSELKFVAPPPAKTTCPQCRMPGVAVRLYSVPVISVPEMNAHDVLNRHIRGEGDPAPGMTQAQTVRAAKAKARSEQQMKNQKSYSGPTISTPAIPGAHKYYGPD